MKKKPAKRSKSGLFITEKELIRYFEWTVLVGYMFLAMAAIMTLSAKLVAYTIWIGLIIGYAIFAKWFSI